jgi:two-component system chemotaxis response regulator CheB
MDRVVRVLVVDDSAYIRKVVKEMLSRSPSIEVVGTAKDGNEALEKVRLLQPDVVTCDLIMPITDGIAFIRTQMAIRPVPTALATEKVFDLSDELIAKVKAAARASVSQLVASAAAPPIPAITSFRNRFDVLVIGISTGGPQGLKRLIPRLPADFPVPVAIVLHMPIGYTEGYAGRLDEASALRVIEAKEGEEVRAGVVLVAPAGRHPSVDVLFQSAADVYHERVLAVVMTGMGDDGTQGAAWIKARGGSVLTEAEESCVVYGMPRAVVEAGLSDASVPLDRLVEAIVERI